MYKLGGSDDYVTCPFNKAHEVKKKRYIAHILKCKKQYPNSDLVTCYYNCKHLLKPEDMPKHYAECADKQRIEGSRYGSSTASLPVLEPDNEKEESVISFGTDFRDSLLSSDDCSSVVSRVSSSIRGRGNALVKSGPLGNASRYAMNQRTTKWENMEVDFLKTYDEVVSDYTPAPISIHPAHRNIEDSPPKLNPVVVRKKLVKDLQPKQGTVYKNLESERSKQSTIDTKGEAEEEFKPLPLPRTTSKAFIPTKRNLQDKIDTNGINSESQNDKSKVNCDKKQKIKQTKYSNYSDEDYDSNNEKQKVNYDAFIFNPVTIDNNNSKSDSSYYRNKFLSSNYNTIIGRSRGLEEPEIERRPGRSISLLPEPDTSNIDYVVPKQNNESKLFLKSGYPLFPPSLFPDHEKDGNVSDDAANYEDVDEEDEDLEEEDEDDSKECPLLAALNKFVKKKEGNRFHTSRDRNSSDETTDSDCQSVKSVIERKPPSPTMNKGSYLIDDDGLSIFQKPKPPIQFPMGRGFRLYKKENNKPNMRPLGRGFNLL